MKLLQRPALLTPCLGLLAHAGHALVVQQASGGAPAAAKPDYNEETHVMQLPVSVEVLFAIGFIALVGSIPFILVALLGNGNVTKAHMCESVMLVMWLGSTIFLFTNVLQFNSSHWTGSRPLTIVEAVYLLSQILTTVGYGDITPAFPRGQVWVAINVLIALCLYGSIIMEVSERITEKVTEASTIFVTALSRDIEVILQEPEQPLSEDDEKAQPLKDWRGSAVAVDVRPFLKSLSSFVLLASIGVVFWHFFPGEGKTWLQAVYMSVITLSTVGFGFFNATTEAGKVFGAFWMLFGVATLAGTIASFVDLMNSIKSKERHNKTHERLQFHRLIKHHCRKGEGDMGMDDYDFMKYGLLLQGVITEEDLAHIEQRFAHFDKEGTGRIALDKVFEAERPPSAFFEQRDQRLRRSSSVVG